MIELYRTSNQNCEDAENALREMVLAHKIIIVEQGQLPAGLPVDTPLPALKDNGQIITGQAAIKAYMPELEKEVERWRKFQGDSCYIDEDGNNC